MSDRLVQVFCIHMVFVFSTAHSMNYVSYLFGYGSDTTTDIQTYTNAATPRDINHVDDIDKELRARAAELKNQTMSLDSRFVSQQLPMKRGNQLFHDDIDNVVGTINGDISINDADGKGLKVSMPQPSAQVQPIAAVVRNFSEQEVLDLIGNLNPTLRTFGQTHGYGVQDLLKYSQLLKEFNINPQAMVGFQKKISTVEDKTVKSFEVEAYKKIQATNPDQYTGMALDLIKQVFGQVDNQPHASALNDTHTNVLNNQIANQNKNMFYAKIAMGIKLVLLAAATAWGLYGQIHSTTNSTGQPHATL